MNFTTKNFLLPDEFEERDIDVANRATDIADELNISDADAKHMMTQLAGVSTQTLALVATPLTTNATAIGQRDERGRFTLGCKAGPGRPRNQGRRSFVQPLALYQRCIDTDHSVAAWKSIVDLRGPKFARAFLHDLEAEQGPVSFRHLALEAITAAEQALLTPKLPDKRKIKKRTSKKPNASREAKKRIVKKKIRAKRSHAKQTSERASNKANARKGSDTKQKPRGRFRKPMSRKTMLERKRNAAKFRQLFKRIVNSDFAHDNGGFDFEEALND
jgi:hypothetical protein